MNERAVLSYEISEVVKRDFLVFNPIIPAL